MDDSLLARAESMVAAGVASGAIDVGQAAGQLASAATAAKQTFADYCKSMGFCAEDLDETQTASLQERYKAANEPADKGTDNQPEQDAKERREKSPTDDSETEKVGEKDESAEPEKDVDDGKERKPRANAARK